ncbi:type IV pilus modification PilV family protein [Dehalogenimonas alkenigignens]|uniref:type IV pilus modification PilV family protein n=1 Tax=Dehalogenimonas alkenigignens TaxID=1217799 RepID=UPI0014033753|nr:prepilin-type N-terminal cleavage/methylation domain-containing protein [Dehalogenimonas alkenigignens]
MAAPVNNRIRLKKNGFSIIEVLIAMMILGIIAAAFLLALVTASKAIALADIRTVSESLARSQLEVIKSETYISHQGITTPDLVFPDVFDVLYTTIDPALYGVANPSRFGVKVEVTPCDSSGTPVPDRSIDEDLQLVVVTVYHDDNGDGLFTDLTEDTPDEKVFSITNYKSKRGLS